MKKIFTLLFALSCTFAALADVPPGYYDNAIGLKKAELKNAMHEIIGKANVLEYGSGEGKTWYGFNQTDRKENNQVIDRYSYQTFYFPENYGAASGMNIEHSMAKSWWGGGKNQAYCDIHHLMPCEAKINSSKSNYPMGVVTNNKQGNGCTKVGTGTGANGKSLNLWEPADEWKGDFARVYFYMATCYSNLNWTSAGVDQMENNDWPTLQKWTYELLLKWNEQDPVSDLERTRNEKVYAIQGNRNPFIDHPDLAEYIWGSKTNEAWNKDGAIVDPNPGDDPNTPGQSVGLLNETFETSFSPFVSKNADGTDNTAVWTHNATYKCAVGNAYNAGKVADAYLVSPVIDLADYSSASLTFDHATGYNKSNDPSRQFSLVITEDTGAALVPSNAEWKQLAIPTWPEDVSSGFTEFANSGAIDLADYCGKKVRIAFRYQATAAACWAWEVRNIAMIGTKKSAATIEEFFNQDEDSFPTAPQTFKVYSINGLYLGTTVPEASGLYIIKTKTKTLKLQK